MKIIKSFFQWLYIYLVIAFVAIVLFFEWLGQKFKLLARRIFVINFLYKKKLTQEEFYRQYPLTTDEVFSKEEESIREQMIEFIKAVEYPITSVTRLDIAELGFDPNDLDDNDMRLIAGSMAEKYLSHGFWEHLLMTVQELNVKKIKSKKKTG